MCRELFEEGREAAANSLSGSIERALDLEDCDILVAK
jgi:hypothetical protein